MSKTTLKRADESAHVVAAKNLADIYVEFGGKRADFFESFAKRQGFETWNAYRAVGRIKINLAGDHGVSSYGPGILWANGNAFESVASLLLHAVKKSGYTCDHSAPLIISDDVLRFVSLGTIIGHAMRRDLTHRSFFFVDDIRGPDVIDILTTRLAGREGLIILDLPDILPQQAEDLSLACPDAIILLHQGGKDVDFRLQNDKISNGRMGKRGNIIAPKPMKRLEGGMWQDRALAMLIAFSKARQPFDVKDKPDISTIDITHPVMLEFLKNVPGFSAEKRKAGTVQDYKAQEQFGFLLMQI